MSYLLFNLNQVPFDEAEEVRELLEQADIDYYESDTGRFGLGVAAIWLSENTRLAEAKSLIADYQSKRCERVQMEHEAIRAKGLQKTRIQSFLEHPIKYGFLIGAAGLLAYFTVSPFFG